jgi:hypothetical protein
MNSLTFKETHDSINIDTGEISCRINKKGETLFNDIYRVCNLVIVCLELIGQNLKKL